MYYWAVARRLRLHHEQLQSQTELVHLVLSLLTTSPLLLWAVTVRLASRSNGFNRPLSVSAMPLKVYQHPPNILLALLYQ